MATHAYIGVWGGICQAVAVDMGDAGTAKAVAGWIKDGGTIERVTVEVARQAMLEPWPPQRAEGEP